MGKRIDKVRNYNQIMLAIAATIGVVFISIASLLALYDLSSSFFKKKDNNANKGIIATAETVELQKDSLRKQIISFNKIQILDSIDQTYIIPVTQANLAEAEKNNGFLGLMNTKSIGVSYERFYGNIYNNLVIYNQSKNETAIVFNERISIEDFIIHNDGDNKYIVIPACKVDSNKDGYLNEDDLQELFIYDLESSKLNRIIAKENYTTLKVYQPHKGNDLIAHFGVDRNEDGDFDSSIEPMIFYRINLEKMQIEEFVGKDHLSNLQSLLEGK